LYLTNFIVANYPINSQSLNPIPNMKKTNYSIIFISFLSIIACKKGDNTPQPEIPNDVLIRLSPEEYQSIAFDEVEPISDQAAAALLKTFIANKQLINQKTSYTVTLKNKRTVQLGRSRKEARDTGSQSDDIPVYKFDISTGAKEESTHDVAIISADERYPVVMAYYTEDVHDSTANPGQQMLLDAATELLKQNISKVEDNRSTLRQTTLDKISKQLATSPEKVSFKSIKSHIAIENGPRTKSDMVTDPSSLGAAVASYGPYIPVAWSGGMPYNRLMAQSCPNNWLWDYRYAISSVVIATAQVLATYQPGLTLGGTTMNWPYLTVNKEIYEESDYFGSYVQDPIERRNMVATLMKSIGESCSVSYTCTGASVNFNNIRNFLSARGISVGTQQGLNVPTIKTAIENLRPVFMYGQTSSNQGHWWVVDGTYITTGTQSYIPGYNFYIPVYRIVYL
jgi:hypothetical protein